MKKDFSNVSAELVEKVRVVVKERQGNTFSVSRIYEAYNAVFDLKEKPETCATCLANRARKLAEWLKDYDNWTSEQAERLAKVEQEAEQKAAASENEASTEQSEVAEGTIEQSPETATASGQSDTTAPKRGRRPQNKEEPNSGK